MVIDNEKCKKEVERQSQWKVTDSHICTFTKIGEGICKVSSTKNRELQNWHRNQIKSIKRADKIV